MNFGVIHTHSDQSTTAAGRVDRWRHLAESHSPTSNPAIALCWVITHLSCLKPASDVPCEGISLSHHSPIWVNSARTFQHQISSWDNLSLCCDYIRAKLYPTFFISPQAPRTPPIKLPARKFSLRVFWRSITSHITCFIILKLLVHRS